MPTILRVGDHLSEHELAFLIGLFDHGVLPQLAPTKNETTIAYLNRALKTFGASIPHECPIDVEITNEDRSKPSDTNVLIKFSVMQPFLIQVDEIDKAIAQHDPRLSASIFWHLCDGGKTWPRTIGPSDVFSVAENVRFQDSYSYFENLKEQIAEELKIDSDDVRLTHVKKYLRDTRSLTPGGLRRIVGSHHWRLAKNHRRVMPIDDCRTRLNALPPAINAIGNLCLDAGQQLKRSGEALESMLTERELDLFEAYETYVSPALIVDTSINDSNVIEEIVDEFFNDVLQSDEFAPTHMMLADAQAVDIDRFTRAVREFESSYEMLWTLARAITAFGKGETQDDAL